MDKGIIKIIVIVMVVYMALFIGSVCVLMRGGELLMQSNGNSDPRNQYNGTGKSFSLSPIDKN